MEGKIRRLPIEVDSFIINLRQSEQIPDLKQAFIKMKDYAILGKETARLAKNFGVRIIK